jgi:RNA polymerase sigma factor (sigma-70 family)
MSEPLEQASDERLIEAIRAGAGAAAEELARRYWSAIQRFCATYLSDAARADDVVQETFAKLHDAANLPAGAVKPWLYKLARNRCLDILRRQQRSPTHNRPLRTGFDAARVSDGPRTKAAKAERQELIREIVAEMPEEYRSVLTLKFFEGLSRAEVAATLEVSEQTVKGRLVRASDYLREQLKKITSGP